MRKYLIILGLATFWIPACSQSKIDVAKEMDFAVRQYALMLKSHPDTTQFPQSLNPDGSPRDMPSEWWCSGFFGGSLWYLYEFTEDPQWKEAAHLWTIAVEEEKYNTSTHDLGFMLYCPFGNGYRLTGNEQYKEVLMTGAASLATRFNPDYGVIKSWDSFEGHEYPVIIDNMMNLEMLLWVAQNGGSKELSDLSIRHANNTLENHFRPDGSSYHVVCYEKGGDVAARVTHQGKGNETAWARGQGWGLYGYTMMYRFTKDKKYLKQAEKIAQFILSHPNLPNDKIPYWDFDAPGEERDASAGALMASALLELSTYSKKNGAQYFSAAEQMLESLSSDNYKAKLGEYGNFLLKHSVGAKPLNSEINVPLVYADYYYLEALLRYDDLQKQGKKG